MKSYSPSSCEGVVEDALEVHALHLRGPLDIGALQRVVHGLGDAEELVAAVDDLPVGLEPDIAGERARGWTSNSATPPPYAVALTCSTRAPWSGAASSRMRSSVPGSTIPS